MSTEANITLAAELTAKDERIAELEAENEILSYERDDAAERADKAERERDDLTAQLAVAVQTLKAARKSLPSDEPSFDKPWSVCIAIIDEALDALGKTT